MSSTASTTPRNLQARTTVSILNVIRLIGTAFYVGIAALVGLATLIGLITSDSPFYTLVGGTLLGSVFLIAGAVFYAVIGWFVDTLALLTQIASNTAA